MQYRGVEITIISAKDLKRVKHLTKMDVYVVVSLSGGPEMEQKTPVDKASGPNPNWNYPMNFNIDEEEAHKGRLALKFEVKCHRRLHSDKDIGEVNVPVKELLDNGGDGKFIKYVTYQLRKPNGKHRGQLNLSYKFANQVLETTSSTKVHDTVYQVPALVTAYYPVNYAATNLNLPKSDPSVGYPIQGGNPHTSDIDFVCRATTLCWALWKARNKVVWNKYKPTVKEVIANSSITLEHWRKSQDKNALLTLSFNNSDEGAELWTPPATNNLKINVDAALYPQHNNFGFGIVARNHLGRFIEAKTNYCNGSYPTEVIEALGIKEALSWIKNKSWKNAELETDSLLCVQAIRSNQKMSSTFGIVIEECRLLLSLLQDVKLRFVKRSANRVAHAIARHSRFISGSCILEQDIWPEGYLVF
uniref:C2 domain-containing protein n=1 Tax=Cannabis sativa TaxID=3483 RepID=A0A803NQJ5_CANSA